MNVLARMRMRPALVTALALLLLAGAVVFARWPSRDDGFRPAKNDLHETLAGVQRIETQPVDGESVARAEASDRAGIDRAAAIPLDGPLLRVVEAPTQQPIAGAAVLVLRGEDVPEGTRWHQTADGPLAALRAHGRHLLADAQGELRLPSFARELWVCRAADERGIARLAGPGPFVLELRRSHPLRVEVRDAAGKPCAGVPVALAVRHPRHGWSCPRTATTGVDGTAVLAESSWCEDLARQNGSSFFAVLDLPVRDPVEHPIDLLDAAADPVVLTLPPVGQVRLRLHPAAPALLRELVVDLTRDGQRPGPEDGRAPLRIELRARPEWIAEDGTVTFPFVALGQRLEACVRLPGTNMPARASFDGPGTPGETAVVGIDLDVAHRLVVLALQDEEGATFDNASVRARWRHAVPDGGNTRWSGACVRSLGDGLCVPVPFPLEDGFVAEVLELTEGLTGALADVVLPRSLERGLNDLGIVTLRRPPLVAAGRVVDAAGEPVADAAVRVVWRRERRAAKPEAEWTPVRLSGGATDHAGRFELRGHIKPGEHALCAVGPGFLAILDQPFALGARDLRIVLARSGGVTGRVLLDEGIAPGMVAVHVRDHAGGVSTARLDPHARFRLEFMPGVARLSVTVHTAGFLPDVGLEVPVPEGAPVDLGEIDLRGKLHRIRFDVVDEAGHPLENACAFTLDREADSERWEGIPLCGRSSILLSWAPVTSLLIRAMSHRDGPRCASFAGVRDGAHLVMPPPAVLTITVPRSAVEALHESDSLTGCVRDADETRVVVRAPNGDEEERVEGPGWIERDPVFEVLAPGRSAADRVGDGTPIDFFDGVARLCVPGPGRYWLDLMLNGSTIGESGISFCIAVPFVPDPVEVPLTRAMIERARALQKK